MSPLLIQVREYDHKYVLTAEYRSDKYSEEFVKGILDAYEAAMDSILKAKYISEIIEKGLENVKDNGGDTLAQIALANKIVATVKEETKEASFDILSVDERSEQLLALLDKNNSIYSINGS